MNKSKKYIGQIILTSMLTLLPVIVGLLSWNKLPDKLPIHFKFSGEPYGYADKAEVMIALPVFMLLMHIIVAFATMPDAEKKEGFISEKIYTIFLFIIPLVSIFCTVLIFKSSIGLNFNFLTLFQLLIALIYIVIGNFLPKIRRNNLVGTKLPWTVKSDNNWKKTNRLTGWMFFIFGFLFLINAFVKVKNGTGVFFLWIVTFVLITLIPLVYSFILSKKEKSNKV